MTALGEMVRGVVAEAAVSVDADSVFRCRGQGGQMTATGGPASLRHIGPLLGHSGLANSLAGKPPAGTQLSTLSRLLSPPPLSVYLPQREREEKKRWRTQISLSSDWARPGPGMCEIWQQGQSCTTRRGHGSGPPRDGGFSWDGWMAGYRDIHT